MDLRLHRRRWLRRSCRFCRDPWPCADHRKAAWVARRGPRRRALALAAFGVSLGLAMVAYAVWLVLR